MESFVFSSENSCQLSVADHSCGCEFHGLLACLLFGRCLCQCIIWQPDCDLTLDIHSKFIKWTKPEGVPACAHASPFSQIQAAFKSRQNKNSIWFASVTSLKIFVGILHVWTFSVFSAHSLQADFLQRISDKNLTSPFVPHENGFGAPTLYRNESRKSWFAETRSRRIKTPLCHFWVPQYTRTANRFAIETIVCGTVLVVDCLRPPDSVTPKRVCLCVHMCVCVCWFCCFFWRPPWQVPMSSSAELKSTPKREKTSLTLCNLESRATAMMFLLKISPLWQWMPLFRTVFVTASRRFHFLFKNKFQCVIVMECQRREKTCFWRSKTGSAASQVSKLLGVRRNYGLEKIIDM